MTNYLYYNYANSSVCKVAEEQIEYEPCSSVHRYFDQECLRHGSTLKGRKTAYANQMNQKQYIPVIVQEKPHCIYFPIKPLDDPKNIWICYEKIDFVTYNKKTCTIHFKDHTCLECEEPHRVQKQMRQIFRYLRRLDV